MKKTTEIKILEDYLKKNPINKTRLALGLGYGTTSTIDKWRIRKNIPRSMQEIVVKFIEENSK